jgi:hypothetical protein
MDRQNDQDWDRWRGAVDMKLDVHHGNIDHHAKRLDTLDAKVSDIVVKLAIPLFFVGVAGPVIGALIVFSLTKNMK